MHALSKRLMKAVLASTIVIGKEKTSNNNLEPLGVNGKLYQKNR